MIPYNGWYMLSGRPENFRDRRAFLSEGQGTAKRESTVGRPPALL